MATKKRTGLGRGIGALIPSGDRGASRPSDVFFDSDTPAYPAAVSMNNDVAGIEDATEDAPTKAVGKRRSVPSVTARPSGTRSTGRRAGTAEADAADVPVPASAAPDESTRIDASSAETEAATEAEPALVEVPGASLQLLDPTRIVPNAHQPRTEFDEEALQELIISVREFGVLQPIVVRPIADDHPLRDEADFELIMGERRLRATKAAGLERIPAVVRNTEDDVMLRDALLENLHRSQLNPLEEASAYQQLLNDFGITQEQLATRIGRSRPQISNTLRLLRLPLEVQRRVAAGVLSAGHARAILSAGEPAAMQQLADKIVNEDLSVRSAEAAAAKSSSKADTNAPIAKEPRAGLTGYLDEIGEQLGDRLNTRVKVTLRRTKGQIVVDFASIADLNRILEELGESAPGK